MPAPEPTTDVVGLGNAIVDVLAHAADDLLAARSLVKGTMRLIDEDEARALYAAMGPAVQVSGGAVANTTAGVVSLGGRAAFVGKVRDDELGRVFVHDIASAGVEFVTVPAASGPGTGRSLILVTPDAQRTMNTFLGIAGDLGPRDVDTGVIASAAVTFLEGFLWDPPGAREALRVAAAAAHGAGRRVAFTLNDELLVQRHREDFLAFVEERVDVVFSNHAEARALTSEDDDLTAARRLSELCEVAVVTRSEQGSIVVSDGVVETVPAAPVEEVVDTTGAGDLYAAGFLYGYTRGHDLAECARIGSLAAAEVISHVGARPQVELRTLL